MVSPDVKNPSKSLLVVRKIEDKYLDMGFPIGVAERQARWEVARRALLVQRAGMSLNGIKRRYGLDLDMITSQYGEDDVSPIERYFRETELPTKDQCIERLRDLKKRSFGTVRR